MRHHGKLRILADKGGNRIRRYISSCKICDIEPENAVSLELMKRSKNRVMVKRCCNCMTSAVLFQKAADYDIQRIGCTVCKHNLLCISMKQSCRFFAGKADIVNPLRSGCSSRTKNRMF